MRARGGGHHPRGFFGARKRDNGAWRTAATVRRLGSSSVTKESHRVPPSLRARHKGLLPRHRCKGRGGGGLAPWDRALPEPWACCLLGPTGCSIPAASGAGLVPELRFLPQPHENTLFLSFSLSLFFKLILSFISFSCNPTTCWRCLASPGLPPVPRCCYFLTGKLVSELFPFLVKVVVPAAHS